MANPVIEYHLREMFRREARKIVSNIIGLIPEPVRKIVGLILLIVGVVTLLRVYPGMLFFELTDQMFFVAFFFGIFSSFLGILFLRHKG